MYSKLTHSWLKHWDFILMDLFCLELSFLAAYAIRHGVKHVFSESLFRSEALLLLVSQLLTVFFIRSFSGIMRRGCYLEFVNTVKHVALVMTIMLAQSFSEQNYVLMYTENDKLDLLVNYEDGVKRNPAEFRSCTKPQQRDTFFDDMRMMGFAELEKKYASPAKITVKGRIKRKIKNAIKLTLRAIGGREYKRNEEYGLLFVLRI